MSDIAVQQDADLAVAVYLEPLLEGRRVLVVGRLPKSAEERITRVAQSADFVHPPAQRRPNEGDVPELPFRNGALDVVFVQDLSQLPEPREDAVAELRRVLSRDGILAICAEEVGARRRRRAAPLSDLLDNLLGREFGNVRLFSQSPVYGQAVEELGESAEDIAVDTALVQSGKGGHQRWLALAADGRVKVDARLWVQLPTAAPSDDPQEDCAPGSSQLQQALNAAEQEARTAARREADALRELEAERRLRMEAEHGAERARRLEERLDAAEADFDDAVARLRWLESEGSEKEALARQEHKRRLEAERQVAEAKAEVALAETKAEAARAAREAAHAESQALAQECADLEKRLVERAEHIQALEADAKRQEAVAKDLLEDLRRIEQQRVERIEHDARVSELESERDRAIQRALEAEVAREAAQMHVDELRTQLHARQTRPSVDPALAGTVLGLKRRVSELEKELDHAHERASEQLGKQQVVERELRAALEDAVSRLERASSIEPASERDLLASEAARGERTGLLLRVEEAERAVAALTRHVAEPSSEDTSRVRELAAELANMRSEYEERVLELEDRVRAADQRAEGLERELDEADRAAEAYSDDGERLEQLERDVRGLRTRLDEVEDELRAAQDDLGIARSDVDNARLEASARIELAQRKESEARAERDEARAALEEARTILAQLQAAGVHLIDA